jgi:hypothetical protein
MVILGSLDRCDSELIEGWITATDHPHSKFALEALLRDQPIGQFIADQYREDLHSAGIGDGKCAFRFEMPAFIPKSEVRAVVVP